MSDILCVTHRRLCREPFLDRIRKIAVCRPAGILLREKDLEETEYEMLAREVMGICGEYGVPCILHSHTSAAIRLGAGAIHMPLFRLRAMTEEEKARFCVLGASCHSMEEAQEACRLGCTYITAGHIFETDCKKGLPGRGLEFLRQVCRASEVPVYAIGGMGPDNADIVRKAGAAGICLMSSLMLSEDIPGLFNNMEVRA